MTAISTQIDFHGQPAIQLRTADGARAVVGLFGAQLLSWIPSGGREWLYLSERAVFDGATAVRGGIPVCFPQFAAQGPLLRHGLVRTREWEVESSAAEGEFAQATLTCAATEEDRARWPHDWRLELSVAIAGPRLDVELGVSNTGTSSFSFSAALHTYLRVAEVENVRLEGLYGHEYLDSAGDGGTKRDSGDALIVEGEIDRIYKAVRGPLLLREEGRSLGIHAEHFPDVVTWNPWEDKCAALADMPHDGFRRMLCVEAAAVHAPITLAPATEWWGRQSLFAL